MGKIVRWVVVQWDLFIDYCLRAKNRREGNCHGEKFIGGNCEEDGEGGGAIVQGGNVWIPFIC